MLLRIPYLLLILNKRAWANPGSSSCHTALASFPHLQRELVERILHPLSFKWASPQPVCRRRKCGNMSALLKGTTGGKCLTGTLWQGERAMSKPEMTRMHHRVVAASMELCTPATTKEHSVWEGNTPTMSIWKSRWGVYSLWAKGHSDYPRPHAHFTEKIGYTAALKNKYFQRCPQREGMKTLEGICKCDCSAWIYQEGI